MKKMKSAFLVALFFGATLALSGCSWVDQLGQKALEKTIESGTGGKLNIDTEKKEMTIKGDNGESMTLSGGENTKLPADFPQDVFVFPDAKFVLVVSKIENDYSVVYTTEAGLSEATSRYKDEFSANGWKEENEASLGEGIIFNFKKENRSVMVTVGMDKSVDANGKTTVSITGVVDKNTDSQGTSGLMEKPGFDDSKENQNQNIPTDGSVMPNPGFPVQE